jgi:hypothetical protein
MPVSLIHHIGIATPAEMIRCIIIAAFFFNPLPVRQREPF